MCIVTDRPYSNGYLPMVVYVVNDDSTILKLDYPSLIHNLSTGVYGGLGPQTTTTLMTRYNKEIKLYRHSYSVLMRR